MKHSKKDTLHKTQHIPTLRFEEQTLTSFAGLVVFQKLFAALRLRERLRACFRHSTVTPMFGPARIMLVLIVHCLLGYRCLRELRFYRDDPMVRRVVGLKRLPDVATISRTLAQLDEASVEAVQRLPGELVLERLAAVRPPLVTLDFDGSVLGTRRLAEGTAVGFNRRRKGERSYYPLICTVAQTGQVLAVLHRSGNVHDSRGAEAFVAACIERVRSALPGVRIETRMDSAFFSEALISRLEALGVAYSISVPFARLPELKARIEGRRRWFGLDADTASFEWRWQPKSWRRARRFVCYRQRVAQRPKQPLQLDLFTPQEYGYEFKVVLTNAAIAAAVLLQRHNGRGAQEAVFAQLKSDNALAYIPANTWRANQLYATAAVLAHNLTRELQMRTAAPQRSTGNQRRTLWPFATPSTLRQRLLQRAGRLIRPQGQLTLSLSTNEAVKAELLHTLSALETAA